MAAAPAPTIRERALRIGAALAAAVAIYYAVRLALNIADTLMRPANSGWVEVLLILFLPLFLGLAALTVAGILLARYAWRGRFFR
jgi:hypothetical protein